MIAVVVGFLMDLFLGDPQWLWHPVRGIGWLVSRLESAVRTVFPEGEKGERAAGVLLVLLILGISGAMTAMALHIAALIHPAVGFLTRSVICYQMLALKSLKDESMKVCLSLEKGDVEGARRAVSMIVGRDTKLMTDEGITKAAVETVAENTSDGVVAPLFYMFFLGALGGVLYKAVNTMDSMVGYQNERYLHFGRAAAKLDDILNFIPSRLAAWLMIGASFPAGYDGRGALRIFRRDRRKHKSPNSAQTEAVCAGALGVELAGDAFYFGKLCEKPVIGDGLRPIEYADIRRANRLLYLTAWMTILAEVGLWTISMAAMSIAGR